MRIDFHKKFKRRYSKLDLKIRKKFDEKYLIFIKKPFDISLNNHQLKGKYKKYRSIDITGDWRVFYEDREEIIIFSIIDTHSNLYG